MTSLTRAHNRPFRCLDFCNTFYLHWGSTDLLWCKKHYVTDRGIQPTSFDAKNVTSLTGGSNFLYMFRFHLMKKGMWEPWRVGLLRFRRREVLKLKIQYHIFGVINISIIRIFTKNWDLRAGRKSELGLCQDAGISASTHFLGKVKLRN